MYYGYEQDYDWTWADSARDQERRSQRAKAAIALQQAAQVEVARATVNTAATYASPLVNQVALMTSVDQAANLQRAS